MKKVIIISFLFCVNHLFAQADPVSWNFSAKKIKANSYEIHLSATVQPPWHIYSQHTPAGGPVASVISFAKNPVVSLDGGVLEKGNEIMKHEEVFKVDVRFFNGTVDFVQKVNVKAKIKTNVSGSIKYMVCNDKECLAPKTVPFNIEIK
ncbi:MAG: protein-disulfide reductase DsbD domain-containing protein [Bacteroidota bacterium]